MGSNRSDTDVVTLKAMRFHARIGVLRALNHGLPDAKMEPRRKAVKKYEG